MLLNLLYNKFIYRNYIRKKLSFCGKNFRLGPGSEIRAAKYIKIDDNFYSGKGTYFSCDRNNPISIGKHVMFGPFVTLLGGNHDSQYCHNHMRFNTNIPQKTSFIIVEDGAWIGANTTLLSGAKVCEGSIIGAMSLVNKYVPPYTIATGVPVSKFRRRFNNSKDLILLLSNVQSQYTFDQLNKIYKNYNLEYHK